MTFNEWRWMYPADYAAYLATLTPLPSLPLASDTPEALVQAQIRLEASRVGARLWRNNVGAGTVQETGSFVRWGLCNDSKTVNSKIKSADLIGIKPVIVTADMIGTTIGQFVSREIKRPGWKYRGDAHEQAQLRWAEIIYGLGGDAAIVTGPGSF